MSEQSPKEPLQEPYQQVLIEGLKLLRGYPFLIAAVLFLLLSIILLIFVPQALPTAYPYVFLGVAALFGGVEFIHQRGQRTEPEIPALESRETSRG